MRLPAEWSPSHRLTKPEVDASLDQIEAELSCQADDGGVIGGDPLSTQFGQLAVVEGASPHSPADAPASFHHNDIDS